MILILYAKLHNHLKINSGILHILAGILFALRLKQKSYTIFFNDKKLSILATCIIVANAGNMYRNWVSISNNCNLQDGKLKFLF